MEKVKAVSAIVIHDGKVLCVKHHDETHDYVHDKYEFPFSIVSPGEERQTVLQRQLRQLLNKDIPVDEDYLFMTIHHTYPDYAVMMDTYICHIDDADLVDTNGTYMWMKPEEMPTVAWTQADTPIMQKVAGL